MIVISRMLFPNYLRVVEFVSKYMIKLNSYLMMVPSKFGVVNV